MNLLYSICVPNLTYCAEVKDLSSANMHKCNVALNDSIRLIFTYNRWESTRHLRQQLNFPNIYEIFHSRKCRFLEKKPLQCSGYTPHYCPSYLNALFLFVVLISSLVFSVSVLCCMVRSCHNPLDEYNIIIKT